LKKKLLKALLSLLALLLAAVAFSSLSFRQQTNGRPMPAAYKKGAFHLHSAFSDGSGGVGEIGREARLSHLDFVFLTDHGRPNRRSSAATDWTDGVLLIGASEFSLNEGHLAAAGYRVPDYIFPPEAGEAIAEVNRDRGMTFISHPLDRKIPWTDWRVRDFSGIELLSLYQLAKKNIPYLTTLFPLRYLFNPDYALTSLISYPETETRLWDRFNREGNYLGIYALDSHAKLQIGNKFSLPFPSYGATFRILNIYVKVARPFEKDPLAAAAAVIAAMRRGDFFNVIESLAPANGFENIYREADGRLVDMGGDARNPGGALIFKLPFTFPIDIVIKKDGAVFRTFRANTSPELSVPITAAGVYRSEIRLASGRFRSLPWIMTNPIFVATPKSDKKPPQATVGTPLAVDENFFQVEKNNRSGAVLRRVLPPDGPPVTALSFTLEREAPEKKDFWVALAHRQKLAAAGFRGFVFEARADAAMRFWLQFRSAAGRGEAAYQHSFLATDQWQEFVIPFAAFRQLYGRAAAPDPSGISSFFFLIDNGNAFSGTQGEIFFRQIGLY
jgi:hypothetical protein